ncbi:MAG: CoA transferase [Burkholderiaceae bacterium]
MNETKIERAMIADIERCLPGPAGDASIQGDHSFRSAYEVSALASACLSATARQAARYAGLIGMRGDTRVQRQLAAAWFTSTIRPIGWQVPAPWDPIAGDFRCADGWLRIHTNAPLHKRAFQSVFGPLEDRSAVAAVLADVEAGAAESAIVAAGGCAARMMSAPEWAAHEQGRALASQALIELEHVALTTSPPVSRAATAARPLIGIRVLDLTRILAGPTATRALAALGADVLRIDPPDWDEPALAPEVTVGKRCARLDLRLAGDRERFERLLSEADVLVHGYRPGALAGLGYDQARRRELAPAAVEVSLCAYGLAGPWAGRRGFDSLVQMSSGIAHAGMAAFDDERPHPLPCQALDHATGYLLASAAIYGLAERLASRRSICARTSLARSAEWLKAYPRDPALPTRNGDDELSTDPDIEQTQWGPARRLGMPISVDGRALGFSRPASALGSSPARFGAPS